MIFRLGVPGGCLQLFGRMTGAFLQHSLICQGAHVLHASVAMFHQYFAFQQQLSPTNLVVKPQ